jgi:hypothetical protein
MARIKVETPDKSLNPLHDEADVVVVGGGPIGLVQAWGMKKINPNLKIIVLEKYEEFQRKHTLVMQHQQLEALMHVTQTMENPKLRNLLQQLRKNPNVRTNVLQETFKEIAQELGVEIKIQEVMSKHQRLEALMRASNTMEEPRLTERLQQLREKPELEINVEETFEKIAKELGIKINIQNVMSDLIEKQVLIYKPKLVIGADGTHSVVNAHLFPQNNKIHYEIDYAMQVRLDIDGDVETNNQQTIKFYRDLAHHGLIATEQVGKLDPKTGKTPVSVQIIIPKEDYDALNNLEKKPNARNAIKPFADGLEVREIPKHLQTFVNSYLCERLKVSGSKIDPYSIKISVNELPASRVKEVFTYYENKDKQLDAIISLNGDSALGLSYFKGLNAGLEASANFFEFMRQTIEQGLTDKQLLTDSLSLFQSWFSPYADKKINEVKQFSVFNIKSSMTVIKGVRSYYKLVSNDRPEVDKKPLIDTYYYLVARANPEDTIEFRPYPHRSYDATDFNISEFNLEPIEQTLTKTGKIFTDFFKPYKASYQLINDLKQPITAVVSLQIAFLKLLAGVVGRSFKYFADGAAHLLRGLVELITIPFTFTLKLITRGIITAFIPHKRIEDNDGVRNLITMGDQLLESHDEFEEFSLDMIHRLLGICNDLHRKFNKSVQRGQHTEIDSNIEKQALKKLTATSQTTVSRDQVRHYFSLFRSKPEENEPTGTSENTSSAASA